MVLEKGVEVAGSDGAGPVRFRFIEDARRRWVLSGGALFGLLRIWSWGATDPSTITLALVATATAVIGAVCVWGLGTHVVVGPDGLEVLRGGRRRRIAWADVSDVGTEESWNVGQRIVVRLLDGEMVKLPAPLATTGDVGGALREIEARRSTAAGSMKVQS